MTTHASASHPYVRRWSSCRASPGQYFHQRTSDWKASDITGCPQYGRWRTSRLHRCGPRVRVCSCWATNRSLTSSTFRVSIQCVLTNLASGSSSPELDARNAGNPITKLHSKSKFLLLFVCDCHRHAVVKRP